MPGEVTADDGPGTRALRAPVWLALALASLAAGPARAADHLVWIADGDAVRTHWLVPDGRGGVLEIARQPHLIVAGADTLWAWRTYRFDVPTCAKDPFDALDLGGDDLLGDGDDGLGACPERPGGEALQLVDLGRNRQREVVPIRAEAADGERHQRIRLLGSAGPVLLVRVDDVVAPGTGRERVTSSMRVWDADRVAEVPLLDDGERSRVLLIDRTRAWQQLRRDPLVHPIESASEVDLSAARLAWVDDRLELSYRFSAAAAQEDGRWSTGTRSVDVVAGELPALLAPHDRVPETVRAFIDQRRSALAADPGSTGEIHVGVSVLDVDTERRDKLERLFRSVAALDTPPAAGSDPRYGERSGTYEGDTGWLAAMVTPDGVSVRYATAFASETGSHMCACALDGAPAQAGFTLGEHATALSLSGGVAVLAPPAPECCGLGWSGDELRRTGGLPRCRVLPDTVKLHEQPDADQPGRAFLIAGDWVTVLPPLPGEQPPFLLVRFQGDVTTSYGFLPADALECSDR